MIDESHAGSAFGGSPSPEQSCQTAADKDDVIFVQHDPP